MRSFTATPRSETLVVLLRRAALIALLTLGPIVAAACSRVEAPPPTTERPTAVAAGQSRAISSPSPSPLVPRGTLAEVYPELRSLPAASAFIITEESAGMAPGGVTGTTRQYTLTRTQTNFAGLGVGRTGLHRPPEQAIERRVELPVQVPVDTAERFLQDLTAVPVADGPYWRPVTLDARFHLEFGISSDAGPVRFYSDAYQGRDGSTPWAVEYGGRQMVIDSAAPWRAYQLISPYLDNVRKMTRDELDKMIRAPVPSPSPSPVAP